MVHSVLHLLGYDHLDEGPQKKQMRAREEAILDYVGATSGMEEREQGMVLDIGGGSTEWVCFSQGRIRHAASIPLGSLNLYNRCVETLLPSPKEQAKIRKQVKKGAGRRPLARLSLSGDLWGGRHHPRGREAVQLPLQAARRQPHHHPEHGGRPPGALLRSR